MVWEELRHNKTYISYFDNNNSKLIYQNNYRFMIVNLKNTIKITLFNPDQKDNLYFDKNNKSSIDFYNSDYEKFPKLNDVKYIEVLLHKDQMICIPFKWIYIFELPVCMLQISFFKLFKQLLSIKYMSNDLIFLETYSKSLYVL